MDEEGWSAATFDGSKRALAAATASTTAEQRMDWLDEALMFALVAGTLARVRHQRQLAVDTAWSRAVP